MYYTRNYYIYYTENIQNSLAYSLLFSNRELEPPFGFYSLEITSKPCYHQKVFVRLGPTFVGKAAVRGQNHEEHKYPWQVSRGIITRVSTHTRQREANERIFVLYMLPMYSNGAYERDTLVGRGSKTGGGYTAAKLQCPATHNAATVLATVIMLVLTARLRSRR